jgi:hypothetical protein
MTDQFSFDKKTVDIIISALKDVEVWTADRYEMHFEGAALGCTRDGVYVNVYDGKTSFVMRGVAFPLEEFPFWQRQRLHSFFEKKRVAFNKAEKKRRAAYTKEVITKNLNTTLRELVKYGK